MKDLNWLEKISIVCARGGEALKWDMPEPWFHTELFGVFNAIAPMSGWIPFDFEVPYKTFYPVEKTDGDEWKTTGANKWGDLCLHSKADNNWCWFELKVRHVRSVPNTPHFARSAQLAFCKDMVALIGLEVDSTANVWKGYDVHTKAYKGKLTPYADALQTGKHNCVAAFVQLHLDQPTDHLDQALWSEESLSKVIDRLLANGIAASGHPRARPNLLLNSLNRDGYSIVVCEWAAGNESDAYVDPALP